MKAKNFITVDTETVGLPPCNLVYDLGYTIATRKTVLVRRSFLVKEIITDGDAMMGAFYAKKIFSHYIPALDTNEISLVSFADIANTMRKDVEEYNVSVLCAYNLNFDVSAIRATSAKLSHGKIFSHPLDLLDLWTFASGALNTRLYHDLAREQGWISPAGNVRTTAEKAYAYLFGARDFVESHTALHDAEIETAILQKLLARKKRIPYGKPHYAPWKLAQTT